MTVSKGNSVDYKKEAAAFWTASPAGWTWSPEAEPGTREFFQKVLAQRSAYEVPWLFELIPFASFAQKRVLELGCGAGYDAYQFCRQGADYFGIDIAPENPGRTRRHLGYYGCTPTVMQADAEHLCFRDHSFEVIFSNGVLHHTPDIGLSFREAHRVLKPQGEFWVIVYHRDSLFFWVNLLLYHHIVKLGFLQHSLAELLSGVECGTSEARPLVQVFSRRGLQSLLEKNGFVVEGLWVRKLRREDFPAPGRFKPLYERIPQRWLDSWEKVLGWYVIAKATKE
jgi:SAM-dependent methyltransferase